MSTKFQGEIRDYLRDEYGIRPSDIDVVSRGNSHDRWAFRYGPDQKLYKLTLALSPSDTNAVVVKKGDIRRLLGPPPAADPSPQKRKLEDMIPAMPLAALAPSDPQPSAAPREQTYAGSVSLLRKNPGGGGTGSRLVVRVPADLYEAVDQRRGLSIARLDDETYEIGAAPQRKTPSWRWTGKMFETLSEMAVPNAPDGALFATSPAQFVVVDGRILAHVPAASRRPYVPYNRSAETATPDHLPDRESEAASAEKRLPTASSAKDPTEIHMRELLEACRAVEVRTPYRLQRVRTREGVEHLAWVAPRIE